LFPIDVTEFAQPKQKGVNSGVPGPWTGEVGAQPVAKYADPVDLARGLGTGEARRREAPEDEAAEECSSVHHSIKVLEQIIWSKVRHFSRATDLRAKYIGARACAGDPLSKGPA
jgi:hypothetical protein